MENLRIEPAPKSSRPPVRVSIVGDPRSQEAREHLFNLVVLEKLVADFLADFRSVGFSEEEVERLSLAVGELTDQEAKAALSLPWEIRRRYFAAALEDVRSGARTVEGMVGELRELADENGFDLGYHATDAEIAPRPNKVTGEKEWVVDGTELDDRDSMKMAYYSADLAHVYGKKAARYVYLIRAQKKGIGAHKLDSNNAWGRATSLPVVARVDVSLGEINQELDRRYQQALEDGYAQPLAVGRALESIKENPEIEKEKRAA